MKTLPVVAAIAKAARGLEKKAKKPAVEFAQVLAAQPAPIPVHLPVAAKPVVALAQDQAIARASVQAKRPPARPVPAERTGKTAPAAGAPAAPALPAPVGPTAAPRPAAEAAPAAFVAQVPEDASLRIQVAPNSAAITLQTADFGDLSLYLRVRQGAAELRVEGAAAPQLERHADELRMLLQREGITLNHLEVTPPAEAQQSAAFSSGAEGDARHERFERPDPDLPPPPKAPAAAPTVSTRPEAGHHVRA